MRLLGVVALIAIVCAGFASGPAPAARKRIQVQAHRGGRALMPENTMPAFRHSLALSVDVLELDLGVSRDGRLVVVHDQYVNPALCKGADGGAVPARLAVFSLAWDRIRQFDCGSLRHRDFPRQQTVPGARIPLLDEVLELGRLPEYAGVQFNIETKIREDSPELTPPPEEFARLVVETVRRHGLEERVILQSFDYRTLRAARRLAPKMRLAALDDTGRASFVELAREAGAQIISPHRKLVTASAVREAQKVGLIVIPWTVNDAAGWESMIAAGVDGIITDDPAGLIELLRARGLR